MELDRRRPSIPVDGILSFEADGSRWTLLFGVNALVRLEAEVDEDELKRLLDGGKIKPTLDTFRAAFWAGLRDYHPHLTLEDAGHLMQHAGLQRAGSLIMQGLLAAMPPADDAKPRPPKAARRPKRSRA